VRFRYRADTGEIEQFQVDDLADGVRTADHDARHDAATLDVARVVDAHPVVTELSSGPPPTPSGPVTEPVATERERGRLRD
jgi:hypothetical protein